MPSWQGELVHDWPRYRIRRTPLSNGEYAIVVFSPDGVPALSLTVVPFKTPHGYVSQAAGAPFSVAFQLTPGAPVLGEPVVVTGHTTGHTTGHDISVTLVEGIDVGVMNNILMFIMFFPLFVAFYIISAAIHESFAASCRQYLWPRIQACFRAVTRRLLACIDNHTKYAY